MEPSEVESSSRQANSSTVPKGNDTVAGVTGIDVASQGHLHG